MLRHDRYRAQRPSRIPVKILTVCNTMMAHIIASSSNDLNCECLALSGLDELCASRHSGPSLIFVDGMMQNCDMPRVCRRIRASHPKGTIYIVLIIQGSETSQKYFDIPYGADDIITVPFIKGEIEARIIVGMRVIELESELSARIVDLAQAASRIQKLNGLLPICSHCKKIRDYQGYWNELEKYISDHSDAEFSHAICPGCLRQYYPDVNNEHP